MPEIKNTFMGGKMNKDLDERLLPNNQMRDALNVEVSTSQGDDVGSLQNSWGNTAHSNLSKVIPGAKCIGSLVNKETDKLYWFIKGDSTDAIVEYDAKLRSAVPVLVDFGMKETYVHTFSSVDVNPNSSLLNVIDLEDISNGLVWQNSSPNLDTVEGISWDLTSFSAAPIWGRAGYLYLFRDEIKLVEGYKYEVEYEVSVLQANDVDNSKLTLSKHGKNNSDITLDISTSGVKKIEWVQGDDTDYLLLFQDCTFNPANTFTIKNVKVKQVDRFLNFHSTDHITAINILDGMLIWTDGKTEPKKINVERCKAGSEGIVNFNATSFTGPELVLNSDFTSDTNWTSDPEWDIVGGSMKSVSPVGQYKKFSQANVSIERGKTYQIEINILGTFTSGELNIVLVDELGGTTELRQGILPGSTSSFTGNLTTGITNENSIANTSANETASQVYIHNVGSNDINAGLQVEEISIKEIAFDWNRTTKVKNASGLYTRNIKEEDITLIKKYPLNAPSMELVNTTKPAGSVIKTSCTTPTNTTKAVNTIDQFVPGQATNNISTNPGSFLDGSGDQLRYNNFVHMYLRKDSVIRKNYIDENALGEDVIMQLDVGPDWSSLDSTSEGQFVNYPLFVEESDPLSPKEDLFAPLNYDNNFTRQENYYEKAWQTWTSMSPLTADKIWCIDDSGNVVSVNSVLFKDFIGGRVYLTPAASNTDVADNSNFWKQGQRVVFGYMNVYNNNSFWTYRDGSGVLLPKPPGVSSDEVARNVNGNVLLDDDTGDFALIDTPTQKFTNVLNDFGPGWTVENNKYIGNAFTSTQDIPHAGGHAKEISQKGPADATAVGGFDGKQLLHNFAQGLVGGRFYNIKMKVKVLSDLSSVDVHGLFVHHQDSRTAVDLNAFKQLIPKNPTIGQTYEINYYDKIGEEQNGTGLGLTIAKRNGVAVEISNIQVVDLSAAPLTIQPLVFSPKPDYETGDLVKLTNSNKAPNGDDVTVTVKLKDEVQIDSLKHKIWGRTANSYFVNADGNRIEAPSSWSDGITHGNDMVGDSDFRISSINTSVLSTVQALGNLTFADGNTVLNSTSTNTADWTTSLEMVANGTFTGNGDSWQFNPAAGGLGLGVELNTITTYLGLDGPNLIDVSQATTYGGGRKKYIDNVTINGANVAQYRGAIDRPDYDPAIHGSGHDVINVYDDTTWSDGYKYLIPAADFAAMVDGDEYVLSYDVHYMDFYYSNSNKSMFGTGNRWGLKNSQGRVTNLNPLSGNDATGTPMTLATQITGISLLTNTNAIPAASSIATVSTTFTFDVNDPPSNDIQFGWFAYDQVKVAVYNLSLRKKGVGAIAGVNLTGGSGTQWILSSSTAQAGQGGDNGNLEIDIPGIIDGKTYKISYDITVASTGGSLSLIGATDVGALASDVPLPGTAVASYEFTWVQGTTNENKIVLNNDANFDGTIGLVSVKEVVGTNEGYPKYDNNNVALTYSAVGANPSFKQTSEFNPRLFFEKNGEYKLSFDYTQYVSGPGGGDAAAAGDATGWGFSISNSLYYENVNTSTGDTDVTTPATQTGVFTFDHSTTHGLNPYAGDIFNQRDKGEIRFTARTYGDLSRQLDSGTIDNISVKANNDHNRITWGDGTGGGADVIAGNSTQIIAYPADPTGAKATGGTFELTAGSYYRMQYQIQNTNYVDQDSTPNCNIKLFDHDNIGKSVSQGGLNFTGGSFNITSSNDGHIYLDVTSGYHNLYWQQSHDKNQLEIAFGPGFAGTINNVEVFELTITNIDYGGGGSNSDRKIFDVEITSIDNNITQLPVSEHKYWNCELVDEEPLFKRVFPRFAYRWKYDDGEYSAISAFTEVAFLPDEDYKYNAIEGYNLSMENTVRRVILNDFDPMPSGVAEIEILYKESNSTNIYTFTTIKGAELQNFEKLEITKEKFHALVESKQLLRPYDNLPRKAIAQEISSNRIIFGNYTQQYDISPSDEPNIVASLSTSNIIANEEVLKSIKSIREYQVGVSYLDMFGRQSPIFSVDSALVSIGQDNSATSNLLTATLNNFPPEWVTHYKYFVKDSAAPYYNISLDRFYQAETSNHVWLSFPSSDFNKIQEDDYLILKKEHNSDIAVSSDKVVKYKILSKKGSAPDFIKMTRKNVGGRILNDDGGGLHFASQASYGGSAAGYPQKDKITFRLRGDVVHGNAALQEACLDNQTGRYIRLGQLITGKPSLFSNYYEILHISRVNNAGTGDSYAGKEDYYEFTLVEALGFDASFVGSSYDANKKLFLEYYREELNQYDNNFEGKFFVKIAKDSEFDRYIGSKQSLEDKGYNVVNAEDTYWAHAYENDAGKNTNTDKGQDTDNWLYDRVNNFNWLTTDNGDWSQIPTDGTYNGTAVKRFPPLMNDIVEIENGQRTNPYIGTWAGTVHGATKGNGGINGLHTTAWGKEINGSIPQRFCIHQAMTWSWPSNLPAYTGQDTDAENNRIGSGFVMGNNYCSFAFSGIGDVDLGSDDALGGVGASSDEPDPETSPIDTNTWFDGADAVVSNEFFDNFKLVSELTRVGTQFRWADDPSNTIYTIKKVMQKRPIYNFDKALPEGELYGKAHATAENGYTLKKDKSVFGYRIDLELDRRIAWSPTATITAGFGYNADSSHTTLVPFSSANEGTTAQIQIIEKRPSEITESSFNPAVFEVEPKERVDLNLYYESAETSLVLKDGMYIQALNNINANDFNSGVGSNYNSVTDIGTIYKPGGNAALPYAKILGEELYDNGAFVSPSAASSGVVGWTLDSATGFTSTYDETNTKVTLNKTIASGATPSLTSDVINIANGEQYQITVDVESINNDINGLGSPPDTLLQVRGWDGSAYTAYYPLSGSTPALTQGLQVFQFTHDSSVAGASNNQIKISIILDDPTEAYAKEIVLKSVSLKTYAIDESSPVIKIKTGKQYDWCDNPNKIKIDNNLWTDSPVFAQYSVGEDLPAGITIRISQIDSAGETDYYKDYILPSAVPVGGDVVITLPPEKIKWHNCFSFGNGVESDRLRDDFNAVMIDKGPRVSTTLEESYKEETRGSGLIFSGIYNSTSGVNQLNQFIQAESITKDLNPDYGSIQKLFTRNTNVVALCEDKILKVLVDKDALFNADGSMQITASHKVLGQAIPFEGEYGISRNPESFANFGYRIYFTDRDRGAVLRLSHDGLTAISEHDMISYFKYKLPNSNTMIGSYDENRDLYNLTLEDITVSFSEAVTGWTSFKSFLPESALSINGDYFSWSNGDIWKHHSNALRNNFYGRQYESSVKLVFNAQPDSIKNFNTLNYEGTSSRAYEKTVGEENQLTTKGWYANYIETDLESAKVVDFKEKEGKWFSNISGQEVSEETILPESFTSQGLGFVSSVSAGNHDNYKTLLITPIIADSIPKVNCIGAKSGLFYKDATTLVNTYNWSYPAATTYVEDVVDLTTKIQVRNSTRIDWESHTDSGSVLDPSFYYATGIISNLLPGNKYYIEAEIENFSGSNTSAGFSAANMTDVDVSKLTLQANGKISTTFVYDNNKYDPSTNTFGGGVDGIHFAKQAGSSGTIKNIRCVNITSKTGQITYIVNTSSTDRSSTNAQIKNNKKVGVSTGVTYEYLYIHSQTVSGIKYAVTSSDFVVTSSNPEVTISSTTNIGTGTNSPGYYGNVVKITIAIDYNAGNLFPNENVESYINVSGNAKLAIDQ